MRVYIIGNDGLILCREPPAAVNEGEIVVASNEELHAAQLSGKRLLALWNALPGVEKRKKVGDRGALIDQLWSAVEALPDPDQQPDTKRASKQEAVIAMLQRSEGATVDEVASAMGWQRHTVRGLFSGTLKKKLGLRLDPGYRTGVKVAVVTRTGQVAATATIYPHEPQRRWDESIAQLARLAGEHRVELMAIGNGTASRETDRLGAELIRRHPEIELTKVVVSEAGASVYSASAFASRELPELNVSLRGAVSIARRLQDPLAELVKIDPQSIGVGQYQHDLSEQKLSRSLDAVVEDCVNAVGVDVNTASTPLLSRVSGIGEGLARSIVSYREANGPFRTRAVLKKVPRLGPKAFELSAGFLRIREGDDPLDASGVHPEAYSVVRRILATTKSELKTLIGNTSALSQLEPEEFTDAVFGVPTVTDILQELEKPGRDPCPAFKTATFREGVEKLEDLKPGMVLEGVVTNVAAFGAFVDVGVHQDGLVHISAMANAYVKDPRKIAKPGDVVRVKVLEVDPKRRRISLTMRVDEAPQARPTTAPTEIAPRRAEKRLRPAEPPAGRSNPAPPSGDAMAEAFRRAGLTGKTRRPQ